MSVHSKDKMTFSAKFKSWWKFQFLAKFKESFPEGYWYLPLYPLFMWWVMMLISGHHVLRVNFPEYLHFYYEAMVLLLCVFLVVNFKALVEKLIYIELEMILKMEKMLEKLKKEESLKYKKMMMNYVVYYLKSMTFLFFILPLLMGLKLTVLYFFVTSEYIVMMSSLMVMMMMLLNVAFLTVFESKVLAAMQSSSGPNVVGFFGLLQAFADAMKLLSKETMVPHASNSVLFVFTPVLTFTMSLVMWTVMPFDFWNVICDWNLGLIFLLAMSSLVAYSLVMAGWASNSKYALLGSLSGVAQLMSYELSLGLILMPVMMLSNGQTSLNGMVLSQKNGFFIVPLFFSFIMFFMSMLAETNSTPFDLPEAESELVSGYNVEYSSVMFVLFFLAEYSNMILMSSLMVICFLGGWLPMVNVGFLSEMGGFYWFWLKLFFVLYLFIWMSATLPSYSYDQLMSMGWKYLMPCAFLQMFVTLICMLVWV